MQKELASGIDLLGGKSSRDKQVEKEQQLFPLRDDVINRRVISKLVAKKSITHRKSHSQYECKPENYLSRRKNHKKNHMTFIGCLNL
jgi:hypothetical protein